MMRDDHRDPRNVPAEQAPDAASAAPAAGSDAASDAERKRTILTWFCAIAVLPLALYAIDDLAGGRLAEGAAEAVIVLVFVAVLVWLRRGGSPILAGRWVVGTGLAVLTWEMAIGGGHGFAMLWFFAFPLVAFFILGAREGLAVVALSIAVVVFLAMLWPQSRVHYAATGLRLVVTYTVVSALAWTLESSRHRYDLELRREKAELRDALDQIRTLRSMLPICAWCKKIRDDEGYWSELESYFTHHSDVRFTHGICPACLESMRNEARDTLEDHPGQT